MAVSEQVRNRLIWLALVLAMASPLRCQQGPSTPVVAVVGASVSAGFVDLVTPPPGEPNRTMRLETALEAVWPDGQASVHSYADALLCLDAEQRGQIQITRAKRHRPDVVVAVDFLFWFGYGSAPPGEAGTHRRLDRLRRGIELLESLDAPLLVGDFPDVRGADPRVLPPEFVPSRHDLGALNAAVREWAARRPKVALFPLARWLTEIKTQGERIHYHGRDLALSNATLLQTDHLHATRLGVGLLAHRVQGALPALLGDGNPLLEHLPSLEELLDRLDVDVDLNVSEAPAPRATPVHR